MRALAWVIVLVSCADEFAFLSSAGRSSMILVEVSDARTTATAYPLTEPVQLRPRGTAYALLYSSEVPEGPLDLAPTGTRLPRPDAQHVFADGSWTPLGALPDEVDALRLRAPDPCASFEVRSRPFDEGRPRFAVPVDDDRVLVGLEDERVVVFGRSETSSLPAGLPHLAGYAHGTEIWLAGPGVVRGHPDRGFVPAPSLPFDPEPPVSIAGSRGDAPFELFLADGDFRVAHFDGTAWTQIRGPTRVVSVHRHRTRVEWIEPGLAVLVGIGTSSVVEIDRDGTQRRVDLDLEPSSDEDSLWSVGFVEGVGLIIGSRFAMAYVRNGERWDALPFAPITPRIDVIYDLGDGAFLGGGEGGKLIQWGPGEFMCTPLPIGSDEALALAPMGDGFVMISENNHVQITGYVASRRR